MQIRKSAGGTIVETAHYRARLVSTDPPGIEIWREDVLLARMPLAAGLSTPGQRERLEDIRIVTAQSDEPGGYSVVAIAGSSLWQERRFCWHFGARQITFRHEARGNAPLGQCYFGSNGVGGPWGSPDVADVRHQTVIYARQCFAPRVNHANRFWFDIAEPQSLGILNEPLARTLAGRPSSELFLPDQLTGLFCPPPLALAFGQDNVWMAVGIGDTPGNYQFNAFDYSGSRLGGAAFSVDYLGYRQSAGLFVSPEYGLHFGYSPYQALEAHVAWIDERGYGTQRTFAMANWHREPIFCGWAEQTVIGRNNGIPAGDLATQENYERWIADIEAREIPFGTLVIDDKWQEHYGTFQVDTRKWPDMPGFIAQQHAKGRHVLLWTPAYHREGLDPNLCVQVDGQPIAADVSHPEYERFLRERIRHLMLNVGADGFKEDWLGGITAYPGARMHTPLHGMEFLRRFQFILYDEAHACKPDALIETQTPHPLFRESSDVLRLNDVWFATRDVTGMMRIRARLARIAGWQLVDCDNASAASLAEWWEYAQAQPAIGIPALYFVHTTESTGEEPSPAQWAYLAALWREYRQSLE